MEVTCHAAGPGSIQPTFKWFTLGNFVLGPKESINDTLFSHLRSHLEVLRGISLIGFMTTIVIGQKKDPYR